MNTLDEKRRLFLDMQEHPEKYSEDELQAMLEEPDMQQDIECFDLLRRSAAHKGTDISDETIANEWQKFSGEDCGGLQIRRDTVTPHWRRLCGTVAAVFIGCLLMIGVAYAAMRIIKERQPMPIAETAGAIAVKPNDINKNSIAQDTATVAKQDSIVKFDDTELESVINTMAAHYAVKAEFKSEKAKHIRLFFIWDKNSSLADVIEVLNGYDRISIALVDNTLTVE